MIQASTTKALTSGLPALAAQINNLHTQCEESYKNSLEFARRAGELLLKVKSQLAHGQWLPWIEENTVISPRTAQVYMRLARNWHEFSNKHAEPAHLSIEGALKLLAPEPEVVEAELVEEKPVRQLPPAHQKPQANSGSIADSSGASQSKPIQVSGWPAAQVEDFAPGVICRVIDPSRKDLHGKKVEILEMATYYLAVVRHSDSNEKSNEKISLRAEQLKPLQRSPNYYLQQILGGIGLPHNLTLTLLHQIADQVKLPRDLLDEISKFG